MKKNQIIKECIKMVENGADMVEIFEWVEENTDLDPSEIIDTIYKKEVFDLMR